MSHDLDFITRRLKGIGVIHFVRDRNGDKRFIAVAPDGSSTRIEFHYMRDQALSDARYWLLHRGVTHIDFTFDLSDV